MCDSLSNLFLFPEGSKEARRRCQYSGFRRHKVILFSIYVQVFYSQYIGSAQRKIALRSLFSMLVLYAKFKVLEMDALFQPMDVALALY